MEINGSGTCASPSSSSSASPSSPIERSSSSSCVFYKLMVDSIFLDKKLRLPGKFTKRYEDELSCIATLTVPSGRIWVVQLEKLNKNIWFHIGWDQFLEFYSVRVGYLLLFTYKGNSNFIVHIFDLTTSEINYACDNSATLGSCQESDVDVDNSQPRNVRNDSGTKKLESRHDVGVQFNEFELASTSLALMKTEQDDQEPSQLRRVEVVSPRWKNVSRTFTRRWRDVTPEEKATTVRAANMLKPCNPFCRIVLRPTYVYPGFLLHIPCGFAKMYLNKTGLVTLCVSTGNKWPVRSYHKNGCTRFSKGWAQFVWDNNLNEGDVCVFELVNIQELVINVAIFRVLDYGTTPTHPSLSELQPMSSA